MYDTDFLDCRQGQLDSEEEVGTISVIVMNESFPLIETDSDDRVRDALAVEYNAVCTALRDTLKCFDTWAIIDFTSGFHKV